MIETLGQLIVELEKLDQDKSIYFDFCALTVSRLCSYRGYYDHLSLVPSENDGKSSSVKDLLEMCRNAVNQYFRGYRIQIRLPILESNQ